jgi:Family of unknown function (DUF5335)
MEALRMNTEIKKQDWAGFFDTLTKRRFEWKTEIEVLDPAVGDQKLSVGCYLNGITAETWPGHANINISVTGNGHEHQNHNIKDPARVALLTIGDGLADVINIEEWNGTKTLVRFKQPMGLLQGFKEYAMAAAA